MFARALYELVYPPVCLGCGGEADRQSRFCSDCNSRLAAIRALPSCPRCARTAPPFSVREEGCAYCIAERTWNFAGIVRVGTYEPPLRDMVLALKYAGRMAPAEWLAAALADAIRAAPWGENIDTFVPVPMHWKRRLQRPCDHARVLTRMVAERLGLPTHRAVARIRYAPSQTELFAATARFENVAGNFAPRRRFGWFDPAGRVAGRTVCVVDNFLSSGATLHETVKAVRRCGAKTIYAAIIARGALGDGQAATTAFAGHIQSADMIP